MPARDFDLAVIGGGSGGLTAARFAARLGARVALVEKQRIGGDCTWTGCIPSKALLHTARVAQQIRHAHRFGISAPAPEVDMPKVRAWVGEAIGRVYEAENPEELSNEGIEVLLGGARFLDAHTLQVNDRAVRARKFLIATGARPRIPDMPGLRDVPYLTYESIFDNDRLPGRMIVVGGGPIGVELGQAYQRFGSEVTFIAPRLLPKDEPEAGELLERVLTDEGARMVHGRAQAAYRDGDEVVISAEQQEMRGDLLLLAVGRQPTVSGLDLEKAGVRYSVNGIGIDRKLRTSVPHIYAAGDVAGGPQFTHFAGWQAFQAARNALLPGTSTGISDVIPWVTFTDPEFAHVGLTEAQARARYRDDVVVNRIEASRTDRAVCEGRPEGFTKLITSKKGKVLGATVAHARAGEVITELTIAIRRGLTTADIAGAIHAYPTYSSAVQQLASDAALEAWLAGRSAKFIRSLSGFTRK